MTILNIEGIKDISVNHEGIEFHKHNGETVRLELNNQERELLMDRLIEEKLEEVEK